jgi:FKBP-type peptidyl-prolyl cis-trans isomerase (trigger factor)
MMLLSVVGCKHKDIDEPSAEDTRTKLDYSSVNAGDYISSIKYKDLEIVLESENSSKETALWKEMLKTVEIREYPAEAVDYYFDQTKKLYMDAAENDPDDYLLLLESKGIDEDVMREQAKALVKEDLIFLYITQAENISVTDAEKSQHFDMYADKYVSDYGYDREYVKENMSELIYESMLYDKTMEYLILNNSFKVKS